MWIEGFVIDCGISSALPKEISHTCAKPLKYTYLYFLSFLNIDSEKIVEINHQRHRYMQKLYSDYFCWCYGKTRSQGISKHAINFCCREYSIDSVARVKFIVCQNKNISENNHNSTRFCMIVVFTVIHGWNRDHFVYAPSHWEMTLQCNVISHWLSACTEWSLME